MVKVLDKSMGEIAPRELAGKIQDIPTLPVIYQKLLTEMKNPDVSIPDIAELVTKDQALVAKILHLVNSAFYGYKQEIKTISRAVVILGFRALSNAALAISVFDYFKDEESTDSIDINKFWEHSIATASIAKVLATSNPKCQEEEAFIVGLLHDMGKLIEKRYFPEDFDKIHILAREKDISWHEAEKSLYKVNHASIGKTVFRSWDFPVSVVEAIQLHHLPKAATRFPHMAALVHIADFIAYQIGFGAPGSAPPAECDKKSLSLLDFDLKQIPIMRTQLEEELEPALEILKLVE